MKTPKYVSEYYPKLYDVLQTGDPEELESYMQLDSSESAKLFEVPKEISPLTSVRRLQMRINRYENTTAWVKDLNSVLRSEFLMARGCSTIDINELTDTSLLCYKALLEKNDERLAQIFAQIKRVTSTEDAETMLSEIMIIKAHQTNSLDSLERSINLSTSTQTLKAWKIARKAFRELKAKPIISLEDVIESLPMLEHVPTEEAFHETEEQYKEAIKNTKMLFDEIPYYNEKDKQRILDNLENYMETKEIVKMWPAFKDKWVHGRLVFKIGSEDSDLFKKFKGVLNTKYFVITVNPVDMLFCSTDQEYSSCYSLTSEHGSNAGLPNFIAQPCTAMCFLSSGSFSKPWKSFEYRDLSWRHVKIKERAFLFNSKDLAHVGVGRAYASDYYQENSNPLDFFRREANLFFFKLNKMYNPNFTTENLTEDKKYLKKLIWKHRKHQCTDEYFDTQFTCSPWKFADMCRWSSVEECFHEYESKDAECYLDNLKILAGEDSMFNSKVGEGSCACYCDSPSLQFLYENS